MLPPLPKITAPLAIVAAVVLAVVGAIDGDQAVALLGLVLGYVFGVATPSPDGRPPRAPSGEGREVGP